MGKGSFRALVVMAALVPISILAGLVIHPRSRAAISSFFAPLPESGGRPARDAGSMALPALSVLGAESVELRTLREDSAAEATTEGAFTRQPRTALFTLAPDGTIPKRGERAARPPGRRRPEIMQRDDESIDQAVQWLVGDERAREAFVDAFKRSGRYNTDFTRIARAWKLPESALAAMLVESAARPSETSDDGSMGLWKLTPDVAHVYGLSMLPTYDERRGVASSTEAAAHFLADLHERFGSWELALVAFGFGYKRTLDELALHGSKDYWELAPSLPRPCTTYVTQVLATAVVLANLERYGLDSVTRDDPLSLSDLEITGGSSLLLVARAAALSPTAFRELNPEYSADLAPRTTFALVVHVPSERLARTRHFLPLLQEGIAVDDAGIIDEGESSRPAPPPVISRGVQKRLFYRVKEGDTLPGLAARHGVLVEMIASDNALDPTSSLRPGMILAIRVEEVDAGGESASQPGERSPPAPKPPPKATSAEVRGQPRAPTKATTPDTQLHR